MFGLMTKLLRSRAIVWILLAVVGFSATIFMAVNVAQDLRLLNSARSDNVQWTLSQAEVEFLEFEFKLIDAANADTPRLRDLRREFDIFYSRIKTLRDASLYAPLRGIDEFSVNLNRVDAFLQDAVPYIDASDADLTASLPELLVRAQTLRPSVRALSNSGLNYFALESDRRRSNVAVTLTQMAAVVTLLLVALMLLAVYLNYLNTQNVRRRAEAIEASNRMRTVIGTALDAVIMSDQRGRVLEFNAAAEQIFGYSAKQAIGHDLGALIVPDHHREAHAAGMQRMRESGEKRVVGKGRIKLEAKRASGAIFPVELAIQSAKTDSGEVFIAFLRDISHRVKAEEELVAARDRALAGEKAKTDFLATMSHEIRTPLNGLLGNLSLLHETKLTAKQARYIRNMDTSGKLLMSHISDVLDITKYDAGKLRLRPVEMNVSMLIQDIIDNQSGAASANNSTLQWGWSGEPIDWIRGDRDRMQHILMNLIGNAVKFTHDGSIRVTAAVQRDHEMRPELSVTVTDTGIGIDPSIMGQIFDDFVTGDSSYGRDVGGTGLGLGIAKRFVQALGGSIDVQSEKGVGSTFTIRIPVEPVAAPEAARNRRKAAPNGKGCHVLLVEDNVINREVAREMLESAGHRVTEATNGREAVTVARDHAFDLILMDISMPVLDGREATREIRSGQGLSAKTPIIAVTANAMASEQEAYLSDGMNDILTKPLNREALLRIVSGQVDEDGATGDTSPDHIVATGYIDDLRDSLGVDTLQVLLDRFVAEVDQVSSDLAQFDGSDFAETAAVAHRIAGSAATMGAVALRNALVDIETAAKLNDRAATQAAIDALPAVWNTTRPLMHADRRAVPRDQMNA